MSWNEVKSCHCCAGMKVIEVGSYMVLSSDIARMNSWFSARGIVWTFSSWGSIDELSSKPKMPSTDSIGSMAKGWTGCVVTVLLLYRLRCCCGSHEEKSCRANRAKERLSKSAFVI